ncbi:hypothetical protein PRO82_002229 [Candidatus Protochlamydia amoebophila]|nr:hypothetical protein [Candidatus Protochlamydia amoebophila]
MEANFEKIFFYLEKIFIENLPLIPSPEFLGFYSSTHLYFNNFFPN